MNEMMIYMCVFGIVFFFWWLFDNYFPRYYKFEEEDNYDDTLEKVDPPLENIEFEFIKDDEEIYFDKRMHKCPICHKMMKRPVYHYIIKSNIRDYTQKCSKCDFHHGWVEPVPDKSEEMDYY